MELRCRIAECNVILTEQNCNLAYAIKNHWYICNKCRRAYRTALRQKNPEVHRARDKKYRDSLSNEAKVAKNRRETEKKTASGYWKSAKNKENQKRQRQRLKVEVLSHYCDSDIKCKHCGFSDIRALTIDHIDGGGNKHRQELRAQGSIKIYQWLKNNNYPEGYQVLCMNCQFIKRIENQELRTTPISRP